MPTASDSNHRVVHGHMWWYRWFWLPIAAFATIAPWVQRYVGTHGSPLSLVLPCCLFGLGLVALTAEPLVRSLEVWFDADHLWIAERLGSYRLRTTRLRWTELETVGVGWNEPGLIRSVPLYHLHLQTLPGLLFDGGRRDYYFGRRLNIDGDELRGLCSGLADRLHQVTGRKPDPPTVDAYAS